MGVLPTILKKVGNQGVRFPVHRLAMDLMCASTAAAIAAGTLTLAPGAATYGACGPKGTGGPMVNFIAGVAAGTASIFATQPIDVIKTRMQSIGAERYGHTWQCGARLLREEGIGVFLNGLGARALRSGLGAGFSFAFYPFVKAAITVTPHAIAKM
jgi:solute carrier family 25 citrate transporter 1